MPSIRIILTRDQDTEVSPDDFIYIRPNSEDKNLYDVIFEDHNSNRCYEFTDSWDEAMKYLSLTLSILPYDEASKEDLYKNVQFDVPGYPSIMIPVCDLNESPGVNLVFSMMQSLLRGWPTSYRM